MVMMVTSRIPIMFNRNPVCTIVFILSRFVPKMIAFGGVAVGIIKARDEAMVAGIIRNMGLFPLLIARIAKMGKSISVEATFVVSSVRKDINATTDKRISTGGIPLVQESCSPNHTASPDD